jgi:hypothetical protein
VKRAAKEGHIHPHPLVVRDVIKCLQAQKSNLAALLFQVYLPFPLLLSQVKRGRKGENITYISTSPPRQTEKKREEEKGRNKE